MLSLKGEQPRLVPLGICTGQVADLEAADPYRYRIGVVRVVSLGHQHGDHIHSDALLWQPSTTDKPPETVLIVGLAHDFQILSAVAEHSLHPVPHPVGRPI